ncbi:unnamed protein product [Lymnaea stagnalis]|uniref:Uncharacterized protein n=1 Tax=Lymnaea stagnalis TaxID=6523 RepID=A0AAV2I5E9_LYMST
MTSFARLIQWASTRSCNLWMKMHVFLLLVTSASIAVSIGAGQGERCRSLGASWDVTCIKETLGVDRFIFWTYRSEVNQNDTFIARCYFDEDCVQEDLGRFQVKNSSYAGKVNSSLTVMNFTGRDENLEVLCYIWDADRDELRFQSYRLPALCDPSTTTADATPNKDVTPTTHYKQKYNSTPNYEGTKMSQNNPEAQATFTSLHILLIVTIAVVGIPLSIAVFVFVCRRWRPLLRQRSRSSSANPYEDVLEFPFYFQPSTASQLPSYGVTEENSSDGESWDTDFDNFGSSDAGAYHNDGCRQLRRRDDDGKTDLNTEEDQSHQLLPRPEPCRFLVFDPPSSSSPTPSSGVSSSSSVMRSFLRKILLKAPERCQTTRSTLAFHSDTAVTSPTRHREVTAAEQGKKRRGQRNLSGDVRQKSRAPPRTPFNSGTDLVGSRRLGKTKSCNDIVFRSHAGRSRSEEPLNVVHRQTKRTTEHREPGGSRNGTPRGNRSPRTNHSPTGMRSHAASSVSTAKYSPTANHPSLAIHRMDRRNEQRTAKRKSSHYSRKQRSTRHDDQPTNANQILVHQHDPQPTAKFRSGKLDVQHPMLDQYMTAQGDADVSIDNNDYIMPTTSSVSNSDRGSVTSGIDRGSVSSGDDRDSITSGVSISAYDRA